jgi:hypothetical protein
MVYTLTHLTALMLAPLHAPASNFAPLNKIGLGLRLPIVPTALFAAGKEPPPWLPHRPSRTGRPEIFQAQPALQFLPPIIAPKDLGPVNRIAQFFPPGLNGHTKRFRVVTEEEEAVLPPG